MVFWRQLDAVGPRDHQHHLEVADDHLGFAHPADALGGMRGAHQVLAQLVGRTCRPLPRAALESHQSAPAEYERYHADSDSADDPNRAHDGRSAL